MITKELILSYGFEVNSFGNFTKGDLHINYFNNNGVIIGKFSSENYILCCYDRAFENAIKQAELL